MAARIEIIGGPGQEALILGLEINAGHQRCLHFDIKRSEKALPENTPDERIIAELSMNPGIYLIIFALERKDRRGEDWDLKARDGQALGIGFVGHFSTKTRKGWLELEPNRIDGL